MTKNLLWSALIVGLLSCAWAVAVHAQQEVTITNGTSGPYPYYISTAASDNHATICSGSTCLLSDLDVGNSSATVNYIRFYNAGTGFNGCNSSTNLFFKMTIPGNASGGGFIKSWAQGLSPGSLTNSTVTGISICITSVNTLTDTTAATALIDVNVAYRK